MSHLLFYDSDTYLWQSALGIDGFLYEAAADADRVGYDPYGNRTVTAGSGLALTFNAANNRITKKGYYYDAAGNLTEDPGHSYIYKKSGVRLAILQYYLVAW